MQRRGMIHITTMMAVLIAAAVFVGMPSYAELELAAIQEEAGLSPQQQQAADGLAAQGAWVYGDTLEQSDILLVGAFTDSGGNEVSGRIEWLDGGAVAPTGTGWAQVGYRFIPDHDPTSPYQGEVAIPYARRYLDVSAVTLAQKTYDGSPVATVASFALSGVLAGDDHLVAEAMQGVTAVFDDPAPGTGKTFTVYLGALSEAGAACYEIAGEGYPCNGGAILKAAVSASAGAVQANTSGERLTVNLDEAIVLSGLPENTGSGARFYRLIDKDDPDRVIGRAALSGSMLDVSTNPGSEGQSGALRIAVECENYEVIGEVTLAVNQITKTTVDFTVAIDGKVYDGVAVEPVPSPAGDWAYRYTYSGVTADGESYGPTDRPPVDAGTYSAEVALESDTHTGSYSVPAFVIEQKPVTVRADSPPVPVGSTVRCSYTYTGFVEGEDETNAAGFAGAPEARCADGTDRAGSYPLTFTALPTARNYVFVPPEQPDVLTVTPRVVDRSYFTVTPDNEGLWFSGDILISPTGLDGFDTLVLTGSGAAYTRANPFVLSAGESVGAMAFLLRRGSDGPETEPYTFQYRLDNVPPLILDVVFAQSGDSREGTLTVTATDRLSGVRSIDLILPSGVRLTANPPDGTAVFSVDVGGDYQVTVTDHAGNQVSTFKEVAFQATAASSSRALWSYSVTPDDMPEESFWRAVRRQIWNAGNGDTLRVELSGSEDTVPAAVLTELAGRDVTVNFVWPGGGSAKVSGSAIGSVSAYGSFSYSQLLSFERQSVARPTPGSAVKLENDTPSQVAKSNIGGESFVISAPDVPLVDTPAAPAATGNTGSGQAASSSREPERSREELPPDGDMDGAPDDTGREPDSPAPDAEPDPYAAFEAIDALQASLSTIVEPAVAGASPTGVFAPILMLAVVVGVVAARIYLKQKHNWML